MKFLYDIIDKTIKSYETTLDDIIDEAGADVENQAPTITASDIDAVRQKIRPCWSFPAGAKDAKNLVVELDLKLQKDGTVIQANIVDKARMKSDNFYKIAAESAKRAVLDPDCNPLPLPIAKYGEWKEFTMVFNPKDML